MRVKKLLSWLVIALVLFVVGGLVALGVSSGRDRPGGWLTERLGACADSPNCVSSRDDRAGHRVDPIAFVGDPDAAFRRAAEAVAAFGRTEIVLDEPGYLHAECRTAIFRFVDDLELELDRDRAVIHVRSASRVGKSDLGANLSRVDRLKAAIDGSP